MEAKISIIVPIYNVEEYLSKCIESILVQTLTEFELILVDDGSPDNSGKICDEYAEKDNRIKVIHKDNGGVSSARNTGVDAAIGEYIGFVDPDDYIYKDMFEVLYNLCITTNSDISICKNCREIDGKLIKVEDENFIREMNTEESLKELFKAKLYRFALWNKLFNKKCFHNVRFPNGRIHEDLSTTYRLFDKSNKAIFTSYIGYVYVKRESSILTEKFNKNRLQSFIGWDEILDFIFKKYPEVVEESVACFTYWCVDNIYYSMNQASNKDEAIMYLNEIQIHTRKRSNDIKSNGIISAKYKFIIKCINLSANLIYSINKIKSN